MGRLYNYVVANQLAENTPYKTALGFFAANVKDLSRATLVSYGGGAMNDLEGSTNQAGGWIRILKTYRTEMGCPW